MNLLVLAPMSLPSQRTNALAAALEVLVPTGLDAAAAQLALQQLQSINASCNDVGPTPAMVRAAAAWSAAEAAARAQCPGALLTVSTLRQSTGLSDAAAARVLPALDAAAC